MFENRDDFYSISRYKHIGSDYELGDITEIHFIELRKYLKAQPADMHSKLDKWVNFLKFGDMYKESGQYREELEKEMEIAMAIEKFGNVSADEKFIHYLMDIEKANRDYITALEYAREEGELKGELKGKLECERKGKLAIAAKLITKGLPVLFIAEVTGLSIDEINQISLPIQSSES
ncbi:MAG: Rpn family recombination-promoting nuclease/putative transposase [Ignavibacteriales bacterium]|nr:Rpn family recombination-promoting nuclease/putative transposase [Ignavibacteriales bacterium]